MNIGQIPNLEYIIIDSFIVESIVNVVDGKLMDDNRTYIFTSIGTFCLFVEMVSNTKERKKGISEPISHFGSNAFSKSNKKKCEKGTNEPMLHFGSNAFSKSNKTI